MNSKFGHRRVSVLRLLACSGLSAPLRLQTPGSILPESCRNLFPHCQFVSKAAEEVIAGRQLCQRGRKVILLTAKSMLVERFFPRFHLADLQTCSRVNLFP